MKLLLDANNVIRSYVIVGGVIPSEKETVAEVDDIPDEVKSAELGKYCYTKTTGFYLNPDYIEPTPTDDDELSDSELLDILLGVDENE